MIAGGCLPPAPPGVLFMVLGLRHDTKQEKKILSCPKTGMENRKILVRRFAAQAKQN